MSDRLATMARFDESVPEPEVVGACDYCDEPIYAGEYVRETYEGETVHDECWTDYCDEVYCARRTVAVVVRNN